ncbi:YciI family protein [Seohaeicola saemankumensis]|uniref:YciI family protein n=1 Tax=Seohaeicola saemankumensis TaxID=481181 RepID=A0ABW3TBD2_9RHOB
MYIRFPLSLRNVDDPLHARGEREIKLLLNAQTNDRSRWKAPACPSSETTAQGDPMLSPVDFDATEHKLKQACDRETRGHSNAVSTLRNTGVPGLDARDDTRRRASGKGGFEPGEKGPMRHGLSKTDRSEQTMHYVIHCLDHAGALDRRLAHYAAHKAYLSNPSVKIVISGPLLADDEETMIGSMFLVDADSLAQVEAFHRNDPFHAAGIWETVSIRPFNKRMDNRA